ncbi:MAG: heme o synthase [Actinomycetota bacterium]
MTATSVERPSLRDRIAGFVALTKPRIIELLLVTTVPAMIVAAEGWPGTRLVIATVVGGSLAAGGANATNMFIDRDIDRLMERTKGRPLVTGTVKPAEALAFAIALQAIAFALLWFEVNLLAASLALGAGLFYIFVYSLWLKRTSTSNIVIGGAAGSAPPMIGWAAVTNDVGVEAVVLFLLVFLWTPPHFWALAMRYADDYSAADVPMLPSVSSTDATTSQILSYSISVLVTALLFWPVAGLGLIYGIPAALAGALFVLHSARLRHDPTPRQAMRTFAFSISMLTVVFLAMAVDELVRSGW